MGTIRRLFLCYCPLVVVDPYKDLNYGEIESYEYAERSGIKVVEPEKEKTSKKKVDRYFCFICDPPQWIYFEN